MNENIDALEKRLEKLEPLEQDALAAKILQNWQVVKREHPAGASLTFPPFGGDVPSASPRSRGFASLSLCPAFAGAVVGAAATFLGMAFFAPQKVEIREIVREVPVKPQPAGDVQTRPEIAPEADRQPSLAQSDLKKQPFGSENQSFEELKAKAGWDDGLTQSAAPYGDLNSLLAQRQALARQMARYEPNDGFTSRGFVPRRISLEEYLELLRELKL